MHELIEEKIEILKQTIEYTIELNEDVEKVFELFPKAGIWLDHVVNVTMPAQSMSEVKGYLRTFYSSGIKLVEFQESDTEPVWILQGIKATIYFRPTWSKGEGATCRLVKIGETTHTYPKYKLVCPDNEEIPTEEEVDKDDN